MNRILKLFIGGVDSLGMFLRYPFLRRRITSPGGIPRKKVVFISLTGFIYQIKLEAMQAKMLQLAGADVAVVVWRRGIIAQLYFCVFGINNIIYFDDYLAKIDEDGLRSLHDSLMSRKLDFQSVKQWEVCGARVGNQVLSILSRRNHGTPDMKDPEIIKTFSKQLLYELKVINAVERFFADQKYDTAVFNEANGSVYGAFFDIAVKLDIDVIQFVQPFRDDALTFKRYNKMVKGLHPNSLSPETFKEICRWSWTDIQEKQLWQEFETRYSGKWFLSKRNQLMVDSSKSKADIAKQLDLDSAKKTAVVFSHVLWDANLFYGEDIFDDYEDWFVATLKEACANDKLNWIIKLHPANLWKRNRENVTKELREHELIREHIDKIPEHVKLLEPESEINTIDLFRFADYGVTSRGTVGMEFVCFGKALFTAGTGRYSGLGFTVDSSSREEYLCRLRNIQEYKPLTELQQHMAKKHAHAVFCLRPWVMASFRPVFDYKKKGVHPLDHDLLPVIDSLKEIAGNEDYRKYAEWVLNSTETDYLQDILKCAE